MPVRYPALRAMAAPIAIISALLALSACDAPLKDATATKAEHGASEIAWRQGDVEDAFAEAAEQGKPVLLYWGAVWCPPCNRLKAGLFKDPEFVAQTKNFIPVYLDGDSKGAQVWGERFKIQGYPTLIVLRPDRAEVTRLSGSGDPAEVQAVLDAVHKGGGNVTDLLQRALTEPAKLSNEDWTILAGYGWQVDSRKLVAPDQLPATLAKLAAAAPDEALRRNFALLSLSQRKDDSAPLPAGAQAEAKKTLEAVLASPAELRANRDTLLYGAVPLVQAAAPAGPDRERLAKALTTALDGFYSDESLGISDRLSPVGTEVALFHAQAGKDAKLPPALAQKVRERVEWADKAADNPYERQAVIGSAARLLSRSGDNAGAERLLKAELEKSKSPYYYMPALAGLAEERGDKSAAVDWLRKGYETSEGPASRVQWGVSYVQGLLKLAPDDKATIEKATASVIGELANQPDSYHQRTRQRLEGLGKALAEWSAGHDGAATLQRLRAQTNDACAAQADSTALAACRNWLGTA